MENRLIYLDHAATTPLKKEVLEEMLPYLTTYYGNPSSLYAIGRESKKAIELARERVAKAINASVTEIFFTGSGTESDNWAIRGAAYQNRQKGRHIITTAIEHHAVMHTFRQLEEEGFEVTYLPVDETGTVDIQKLINAIQSDTTLISVMYANNEIGTLQPIKEIAKVAQDKGICFHTDAVQAVGSIPVDVKDLGVDLLSLSGHKFYGPKGVGVLYIKKGVKIQNYMNGGAQERNKRAGTENIAGIVGIGKAIELSIQKLEANQKYIASLRDLALNQILSKMTFIKLNGHKTNRLPGNLNLSFQFVEGESMTIMLDQRNIAVSSGSACASGSFDPSHVLLAIGLSHELAFGSIRFSFGEENTEEDVDLLVEALIETVTELRKLSPLFMALSGGVQRQSNKRKVKNIISKM